MGSILSLPPYKINVASFWASCAEIAVHGFLYSCVFTQPHDRWLVCVALCRFRLCLCMCSWYPMVELNHTCFFCFRCIFGLYGWCVIRAPVLSMLLWMKPHHTNTFSSRFCTFMFIAVCLFFLVRYFWYSPQIDWSNLQSYYGCIGFLSQPYYLWLWCCHFRHAKWIPQRWSLSSGMIGR